MAGTELRTQDDGWAYDRAILAWRAEPSKANYDARVREQVAYYASLRGYLLLEDEPEQGALS